MRHWLAFINMGENSGEEEYLRLSFRDFFPSVTPHLDYLHGPGIERTTVYFGELNQFRIEMAFVLRYALVCFAHIPSISFQYL